MIDLKIDGKTTKLVANFRFYQNIVGKDKAKINGNFESFINKMLNGDLDTLLDFYFALADHKIDKDEIISQLEAAKAFDDIDKEFDDDIQLLCDSGFFRSKILQWHKSQKDMLKAFENVVKELSKKISDGKSKKESAEYLKNLEAQMTEAELSIQGMKVVQSERNKVLKKHKII